MTWLIDWIFPKYFSGKKEETPYFPAVEKFLYKYISTCYTHTHNPRVWSRIPNQANFSTEKRFSQSYTHAYIHTCTVKKNVIEAGNTQEMP